MLFLLNQSSLEVCTPTSSVVDPNTLNLDPDPGFWPNLDPIWKKKFKIIIEKIIFFNSSIYFLVISTYCHKEIFNLLSLRNVNYYHKSDILCLHFILYLHVWIRIRITNTDPNPGSSCIRIQYGFGSTTLPACLRVLKPKRPKGLENKVVFKN